MEFKTKIRKTFERICITHTKLETKKRNIRTCTICIIVHIITDHNYFCWWATLIVTRSASDVLTCTSLVLTRYFIWYNSRTKRSPNQNNYLTISHQTNTNKGQKNDVFIYVQCNCAEHTSLEAPEISLTTTHKITPASTSRRSWCHTRLFVSSSLLI